MAKKQTTNTKAHKKNDEALNPAAGTGLSKPFLLLTFRTQSLILAMIGFIFYCNTFSHESAFDDRMAITDNEYVQKGVAGISDILTKDAYQSYIEHKNGSNQLAGGRYRPLSLITFAIEQQFMGVNNDNEDANAKELRIASEMHSRHVVNVLLYILSVIVLLYFLRHIIFPNDPLIAFIAALLFTIHPIHTEVVANVKSRDEILSVLFISLTFIKAFRYKETLKIRDLILALLFFFLALLSKEYAATLILLLPLSFCLFKNEPILLSLKNTLLYLIPLALYVLLRLNAVTSAAEGAEHNVMNNPYLYATGMQRIATEIMILLDYLRLLIYPAPLIADYSYAQIPYTDFSNMMVWLSLVVYLGLLAAMFVLFRKRNVLSFAIAFYLINLALVSNFFFNIGTPMGERLIYHSSMGFSIAAAWLICKGFARLNIARISRGGLAGFMVVLIIASGFTTIERNKDWKNDETLFLTDVKNAPNSVLINNNAAAACMSIAKKNKDNIPLRNEWFEKAVKYFDKALATYPDYTQARMNRGLCYFNMGNPDMALPDWDTVRKYEPAQENIQKYLTIAGKYFFSQGMKYLSTNRVDSAIVAFKKSMDANANVPETWYELGNAYYINGLYPDALKAVTRSLQLAPNYDDARKLEEKLALTTGPG